MSDNEDSKELAHPEPDPETLSPADEPVHPSEPRTARFGEGQEGAAARRERDVTGPRAGFFTRTSQFIRDVRAEMKRVSWPSATDVKNTTIIVVIAVIFFAVYLFVVDRGLVFLITQLDHFLKWITGTS